MRLEAVGRGISELTGVLGLATDAFDKLGRVIPVDEVEDFGEGLYETARNLNLTRKEMDILVEKTFLLGRTVRTSTMEIFNLQAQLSKMYTGIRMSHWDFVRFVQTLDREFGRLGPEVGLKLASTFERYPEMLDRFNKAAVSSLDELRGAMLAGYIRLGREGGREYARMLESASNIEGLRKQQEGLQEGYRRTVDSLRMIDKFVADSHLRNINILRQDSAALIDIRAKFANVQMFMLDLQQRLASNPDLFSALLYTLAGAGAVKGISAMIPGPAKTAAMAALGSYAPGLAGAAGAAMVAGEIGIGAMGIYGLMKALTGAGIPPGFLARATAGGPGLGVQLKNFFAVGQQGPWLGALYQDIMQNEEFRRRAGSRGGHVGHFGGRALPGSALPSGAGLEETIQWALGTIAEYIMTMPREGAAFLPSQISGADFPRGPGAVNWAQIAAGRAGGLQGAYALGLTPGRGMVTKGLPSGLQPWKTTLPADLEKLSAFIDQLASRHLPAFNAEMSMLRTNFELLSVGGRTFAEIFEKGMFPMMVHQRMNSLIGILKDVQDQIGLSEDTWEQWYEYQRLIDDLILSMKQVNREAQQFQLRRLTLFPLEVESARMEDELKFLDQVGGNIGEIIGRQDKLYQNEMRQAGYWGDQANNWREYMLTEEEMQQARQEQRTHWLTGLAVQFREITTFYDRQRVYLDYQQRYWDNIRTVVTELGAPLGIMAEVATRQLGLAQENLDIKTKEAETTRQLLVMHGQDPTTSPVYIDQLKQINQLWADKVSLVHSFHRTVIESFRELELGAPGGTYWMAPAGRPSGAQVRGSAYFPGRGLPNILTGAVTPFAARGGGQGTYEELYGGLARGAGFYSPGVWGGYGRPRGELPMYNENQMLAGPTAKVVVKAGGAEVGELTLNKEALLALFGEALRPNRSHGGVTSTVGALR